MSTDRWRDKEEVVHVHSGILLSHKKEHVWLSSNKVDEPRAYYAVMCVRKTQTNTVYQHTNMDSGKGALMSLSAGQQWTRRLREQTVDAGWGGGDSGKDGGSHGETHASPYAEWDNQWKSAVWHRELKPVRCENLEGGGGAGGGREVQEGGHICIHVPTASSCWYMAETNTIL